MSTPAETLAIMLQRARTHMEKTGLSTEFDTTYRGLSGTLFRFEGFADVDASALLRDAEAAGVESFDDITNWECTQCGDTFETDADDIAAAGAPSCCGHEMERTDD